MASLRQPGRRCFAALGRRRFLAIAINGSRGLPQYFVQAWPPLALAAGVAARLVLAALRPGARRAGGGLLLLAVPRVTAIPEDAERHRLDARTSGAAIDERTYLGRFGRADSGDKYAALADLATSAGSQRRTRR